jgi:cytochrome c-type biogenesis protein CcmF
VVLEAYMFPYINVLWLGCIVMIIGTVIAIKERRRVNKLIKPAA